ncbi:MAG: NADH-quinone oxidoreductase subunit C [Candidatus Methanoperedens sp.]|nr:NADH-quinone oxidoreductase subunit C [Candidatus Methanoperedens sp.]CAG1003059.1 hydrogenase, group IVf [Methanosarcinales archaeon]
MNANIESIKKEFNTNILEISTSHNETYLTVKKEVIVKMCDYIYHHLDLPLVCIFATDERKKDCSFKNHYVFSDDRDDAFIILRINIDEKNPKYLSITNKVAAANWYEREIQDMFGLIPLGHPDPRRLMNFEDWPSGLHPLRKDFDIKTKPPRVDGEYIYRRVEGEGVYEIPVGPVHAGVIEPGHFRFSVAGEPIINLEIRHFYTHKGVEKLFENIPIHKGVFLAERISGDNSVAHAAAFCQAMEKITGVNIPPRAKHIRTILLELERIYNHIADIAGIATDVAFSFGAAHANKLKEEVMQLNERITGSRLLRGMNTIGGVRRDIGDKKDEILLTLSIIQRDFRKLMEHLNSTPSLMDRIETTGRIYNDIAKGLHVVGPVGRASGIDRDTRRDHPYAAYNEFNFKVPVLKAGDVHARTMVRADEVCESVGLIEQALWSLPEGDIMMMVNEIPEGQALGYCEAPRGETIYWIRTSGNMIERCKVRDPSFCNWLSIEYAVLDNIVPDFPIINKSLSLSYSGNDM